MQIFYSIFITFKFSVINNFFVFNFKITLLV